MGPGPLVEKHCYKTYTMEMQHALHCCLSISSYLHQSSGRSEAHFGDRLTLSSTGRSVEARAGAGEGAQGSSAGGDGGLRYTKTVHFLYVTERSTPSQRVYDLQTPTTKSLNSESRSPHLYHKPSKPP